MTNKEISKKFSLMASLMELLDENTFKIKAYQNTYFALRKWDIPLVGMDLEEIVAIKGIGKSMSEKIKEILETGEFVALSEIQSKVPSGVIELLEINGLGPKKVKVIWQDLGIESIGDLQYACNENRLVLAPGFGLKTQQELLEKIQYYLQSKGSYLFASLDQLEGQVLGSFENSSNWIRVGDYGRCSNVCAGFSFLASASPIILDNAAHISFSSNTEEEFNYIFKDQIPVKIMLTSMDQMVKKQWELSASNAFLDFFKLRTNNLNWSAIQSEQAIFDELGVHFVPSRCREETWIPIADRWNDWDLIESSDIKGVVHNHSTWSDGIHSLEEMGNEVKRLGYEYFVISDHSKSAGYAGGLKEESVLAQWEEIDKLNRQMHPFKIFKSIESDILIGGNLDYDESILKGFDLVIASIHSVLNMDEEKATNRLIKAIENPYTRILGHPSGRLLLSRKGYDVNWRKVIDACSKNNVAIEINANPYRLDIDWTWIPYCIEKEVKISINPDAHNKGSISDIKYGVIAAQKGGLRKEDCINTLTLSGFESWIAQKNHN